MARYCEEAAVEHAIAKTLKHASPFGRAELASIITLFVDRCRDLTGLMACENLVSLYVSASELASLEPLTCLDLTTLQIRDSCLSDWGDLALLGSLRSLKIECCDIEDLSPLLSLYNLSSLHIAGCALSEESYYQVLPALEERGVLVRGPDERQWRLSRSLRATGANACLFTLTRVFPRRRTEHFLISPGMSSSASGVRRAVRVEPEQLERIIRRGGDDLHALLRDAKAPDSSPFLTGDLPGLDSAHIGS